MDTTKVQNIIFSMFRSLTKHFYVRTSPRPNPTVHESLLDFIILYTKCGLDTKKI